MCLHVTSVCFRNVCSYRLSLSLSSSSILLLPLLMPGEKLHLSGLLFFANVLLSFFIVFLRRLPSLRLDRNCLHPFFDRLWLSDRLWFLLHINRQNSVLHRRFDLLWIRAFWESKNSLDSTRGPFDGMTFHAPILRLILLLLPSVLRSPACVPCVLILFCGGGMGARTLTLLAL